MSNYGLVVKGAAGSFQFDNRSMNMYMHGARTINLKNGRETDRYGLHRIGWKYELNLKPQSELYAIHSSQWVRVGNDIENHAWASRYDQYVHQDIEGGAGVAKVFFFKMGMVQGVSNYGLKVFGENGGVLSGKELLKIIDVVELPYSTRNWSYRAPKGRKIALLIGGGESYREEINQMMNGTWITGYMLKHTYFRIIDNGEHAQISFRDSMYMSKYNIRNDRNSLRVTLRVVVVDVTDIINIPDF